MFIKAKDSNKTRFLMCVYTSSLLRYYDTSYHQLRGDKQGFIKGEAVIVQRANSPKKMFEEKIKPFRSN